jgi:uracil-DNA glycosylase
MISPSDIIKKIRINNPDANILPKKENVLRALSFFEPKDTKVIIIGQDPYPNAKDACGLAFSIEHDKIPPSLKNIFSKLRKELGHNPPKIGDLTPWAKQGVLLLNSILTVEEFKPMSHENMGWEEYTTHVIQQVLDQKHPVVIIAWGNKAKNKIATLKIHEKSLVITGGHPSPLNTTGSFFRYNYFSLANDWLKMNGVTPINWDLEGNEKKVLRHSEETKP